MNSSVVIGRGYYLSLIEKHIHKKHRIKIIESRLVKLTSLENGGCGHVARSGKTKNSVSNDVQICTLVDKEKHVEHVPQPI